MKTLIVVDMQEHFEPPEETIDAVVDTIERHVMLGSEIVLLEDSLYEPTVERVAEVVKDYPAARTAGRIEGSGRAEIGTVNGDVEVCGIYTSACVRSLVDDLEDEMSITVIERACYDCFEEDHEHQIEEWRNSEKVAVA